MISIKLNDYLWANVGLEQPAKPGAVADSIEGITILSFDPEYIYDEGYPDLFPDYNSRQGKRFTDKRVKLYWIAYEATMDKYIPKYGLYGNIRKAILQHKKVARLYRQIIDKKKQAGLARVKEVYEKLEPGFKQLYGLTEQ